MERPEAADAASRLAARVLTGETRAVARAISFVEGGGAAAEALARALHAHAGRARLVGLTGPPGVGKSTLVSQLVGAYRRAGHRVGVLAIDPSSPFTGGALLGDRVRMQAHALDPDVFIRSMATRGHLGGLSAATLAAVDVLDAAGFDIVLVETVGVGQGEVEVALVADVRVVVTGPGAGDDVQALKAGLMEIGDVFVVNKADQPGSERAVAAIDQMLALDEAGQRPRPPVLSAVATTGEGVGPLITAIDAVARDEETRRGRRRQRAEWRLVEAVSDEALRRVRRRLASDDAWQAIVGAIAVGEQEPHDAAGRLIDRAGSAGWLDHVGVLMGPAADAAPFFGDLLGLPIGPPEDVAGQGVRVRFVETGDSRIELIAPIDESSPTAASLRRRAPGLHHLALRVDNLAETLARLEAAGIRLIDRVARPGAHGTSVAFLHPSSAQGILVELVEYKRAAP